MKLSLAFFCLCGILSAQSKTKAPETLVISNANVVDVREGQITRNVTVVIKNNRISEVAHVGLIGPGRGVTVVNASGKFLMPGLWDMHVHSSFVAPVWDEKIIYPLYIANGITGIRDMGGNFEVLKQTRQRIEKGELPGPHIVMAGPFLIAAKPDAQTIPVQTPEDARAAVDKLQRDGADFIKILSRLSRESYFAVAEEAKKDKIFFVGHVPETISAAEASAAGQRSIEHLSGLSLACSSGEDELRKQTLQAMSKRDWQGVFAADKQAVATYDGKKSSDLFLSFVKNSTWQVPTLIWTKTQANLDAAWESDPRLKYVPASVRAEWNPKTILSQTPPGILADYKLQADNGPHLVKIMRQAGVQFLAGSDGPDPYVFPGFSLHDELELLVKSGFTPAEALETATSNPALFLDQLDKYGVVEKGYIADLVLLDADPLEEIANTRKIAGVVLGGKYFSREELDKMLTQVEELAKQK